MEKENGIIIRKFNSKGYGFIKTDSDQSLFFHLSGVIGPFGDLREGMRVEFYRKYSRIGIAAIGVQPVERRKEVVQND